MKFLQITLIVILMLVFSGSTSYAYEHTASKSSAAFVSKQAENTEDNRAKVLKGYLASKNSPLTPFAEDFVKSADRYNLDYRFVVAISGLESTFGQAIPYDSYNGWGWGIYGNNMIRFHSWSEAIETISKGLRENYLKNNPDTDPYFVGPSYAASPTWAVRVEGFMEQIDQYKLENAQSTLSLAL